MRRLVLIISIQPSFSSLLPDAKLRFLSSAVHFVQAYDDSRDAEAALSQCLTAAEEEESEKAGTAATADDAGGSAPAAAAAALPLYCMAAYLEIPVLMARICLLARVRHGLAPCFRCLAACGIGKFNREHAAAPLLSIHVATYSHCIAHRTRASPSWT